MRILVTGGGTGGHLYPGLAIARALVRLNPAVSPFFVGATRGIERELLPATEFEHILLDLHPLYRSRPWRNVRTLKGVLASWGKLSSVFSTLKPALVLGTGGYVSALPLAVARRRLVPIALQEQNSHPGLTTRMFSKAARDIYLGFPEAATKLSGGIRTRMLDTGNPIQPPPQVRRERGELRAAWKVPERAKHVVLITGGSQGAAPINDAIADSLHNLAGAGVFVIWATGRSQYARFEQFASDVVRVVPYLETIADAYALADIAVCRAGAITTAELCAWGIPSILIPLPTAAADHQRFNAESLERAGCARLLPQAELTSQRLSGLALSMLQDDSTFSTMRQAALARGRPDAAEVIANHILETSHVT